MKLSAMRKGLAGGVLIWVSLGYYAPGDTADILARPGRFTALTEPPCSYCSTQNRKNFVKPNDPVVAWLRGDHNGGAIPLRHFLAAPRVINGTYGLFVF